MSQLQNGIVKKNGERLDYGSGVRSKTTLIKSLRGLENLGLIKIQKNRSAQRGLEASTYTLHFVEEKDVSTPITKTVIAPITVNEPALLQKLDIQETVLQYTEKQQQKDVVVSFLTFFGIAKTTAKRLASHFGHEYIILKTQYLTFIQETKPKQINSPSAWLRKAIENDYAAPDGFLKRRTTSQS